MESHQSEFRFEISQELNMRRTPGWIIKMRFQKVAYSRAIFLLGSFSCVVRYFSATMGLRPPWWQWNTLKDLL
jgi:hypothetical protein